MKKKRLTFICFLISVSMFSQSRDQMSNDLVDLLKSNNKRSEIFYNKAGRELNINGYQIPIVQIKYRYKESNGAVLEFECVSISKRNCIFQPFADKYVEKFAFPMIDKESVYKAIELIDQVRITY